MALTNFINGINEGFREFGEIIVSLINFILLSLVYFLGIGLASLVAKALGKHFLDIKNKKDKKTYFKNLDLSKESEENYYHQF